MYCKLYIAVSCVHILIKTNLPNLHRDVLIGCVSSYFILMGVLTLYTTFAEKGIFTVAIQKDGNTKKVWQASSEMKK